MSTRRSHASAAHPRCPELHNQRGFTLVESMLGLAISSIILGGLVLMLFQFYSLTRKQQDALTLNHQLQSAATLLNRDIVGASSITYEDDEDTRALYLTVPQLPTASDFGQSTVLISHTVVYTYSSSLNTLSRDDLNDETTPLVLARHIDSLYWASGISNTVELTISVSTASIRGGEADSRTTRLTFHRRPAGQ